MVWVACLISLFTNKASLSCTRALSCSLTAAIKGISKLHDKSRTPKKRSKKRHLTRDERRADRELSRRRIVVENVIRSLKIFGILLERYRNRRKRISLRFNLIAGLYNFELNLYLLLQEV
jgi:hypothetical protein